VRVHCAQCHAIDRVSDSPLAIAPPFRTLHLKFPIESLRRRLAEGIVADHPTMPQIPARSGSARGCDGVSADIRALTPSRWTLHCRRFSQLLHLTENQSNLTWIKAPFAICVTVSAFIVRSGAWMDR
jgi:hypothetical protein